MSFEQREQREDQSHSLDLAKAVIAVNGVSKNYRVYDKPIHRLVQGIVGSRRQLYRDFWALRDIEMHVHQGETVGIVGRNGSGKSTLLQIIAGTLSPTLGTVQTRGRIAALLELGSGFNPEFTGLENIYLNSALLGLTRAETDERLDAILAFADIGGFVKQPVKTYSSGMAVRLAFSVQAQVNPQILIVDEALAVGDARFQAKCFTRLKQLKDDGAAILFVTHSTEQVVNHCDRAVLIDAGQMVCEGKPKFVVNRYLDLLFGRSGSAEKKSQSPDVQDGLTIASGHAEAAMGVAEPGDDERFGLRANFNPHEYRWGDGAVRILDFGLFADGVAYPGSIQSGSKVELALRIRIVRDVHRPILGLTVKTKEGVTVYGSNSEQLARSSFNATWSAGTVLDIATQLSCSLASGDYFVSVGIASRDGVDVVPHDRRYDAIHFHVTNSDYFGLADLGLQITDPVTVPA